MVGMQVSVANGAGLMREVTIDLSADELAQKLEQRLQQYGRTARIPGFRPGKVPLTVLRRRYEEPLRSEILQEMVQASLAEALIQAQLQPAVRPELEFNFDPVVGHYSYKARFEILPQFELKTIAGVTIKRPVASVTEQDIDAMIERLRRQYGTWQVINERGAEIGDRIVVDFEGLIDGEPFSGGKAENFTIELGTGQMIPGFEAQLIGARSGEERQFDLRFPENYHGQHLAGREARFTVRIDRVLAISLAELDAEFFARLGIENGDLTRLRVELEKTMAREMTRRIYERIKSQVFDAWLAANPIDLPLSLIEAEKKMLELQTMPHQGMSDIFFEQLAQRRVAIGLLIKAAIEHYKLKVSEEAMRAKLNDLAGSYERPQEFIAYYLADPKGKAQIEAMVMEEMIVDQLLKDACVVEESSSFNELTANQFA